MAGDERVMDAAGKSLGTSKNVILTLSNFDSTFTELLSTGGGAGPSKSTSKTEEQFEAAEKILLRWVSNSDTRWEDSPYESAEYLSAVDEILLLTEDLTLSPDGEIMERAENILNQAMLRLQDEFRHILVQSTVPLGLDAEQLYGSISSVTDGTEDFERSVGEEQESFCEERWESLGDDLCVDLMHPAAVADLKEIAYRMMRSGYEKECCQIYTGVRRDFLDEWLSILGVENLSIEQVQTIEWMSLAEKMKKWIHAIKIVVSLLLSGEKQLCDQVFGGSELITEICFTETAKGCVMQLIHFVGAVLIGRRAPEKLFRILDMYDALTNVLPDLEALFSDDDSGNSVFSEARGMLDGLGEAVKDTFAEFEKAVLSETSRKPIQGATVHPLARYVMNYVRKLVDYSDSLNSLLESSSEESDGLEGYGDDPVQLVSISPIARRVLFLISSLETNLKDKSKLYWDVAMQYIFLMNNSLYIFQKVKGSELGILLGDNWLHERHGQIRQFATSYLRASWSKVLSCLKEEGIGGGECSSNVSKVALKERFKNFNLNFEEIYKNQTAWKVPDPEFREQLQISISEKVIPAYRSFIGRFGGHLENGRHVEKYIKYTPEDLENSILDLFQGSLRILHPPRQRS
ncbi:hypothetical protein HHK36_007571 [Tetracentron sinense]|uniref:Exocyst subunit Exo70 family protein n=1 Tax=Tetracentron sinense TaxID=13715 RepID=A0A834ZJ66_TETSI|nr:hypothetical protein HHK36_007571 [Tetracentron sinense]